MAITVGSIAPPVDGVEITGLAGRARFYKVTCSTTQLAGPPMSPALGDAYPGAVAGVGQDPIEDLAAFSATYGWRFRRSRNLRRYPVSDGYGIVSAPTVVVVDEEGRVADVVESWDRDGATGLLGLTPDAPKSTVETLPRLGESLQWAKLSHVPLLRNEIAIEHRGIRESTFTNSAGPAIRWKITFPLKDPGQPHSIMVDGVPVTASLEWRPDRRPVISTIVSVAPGQSRTATYRG